MRVVSLTLLSLALAPCLLADPLTQADREALKERLQKIQEVADAKLDARLIGVGPRISALTASDRFARKASWPERCEWNTRVPFTM